MMSGLGGVRRRVLVMVLIVADIEEVVSIWRLR